jgi:hypothetical protein
MSAEAMKVNELLYEAADFCRAKADEIRAYVNQDIRSLDFLIAGEEAALSLKEMVNDICDLTLDEEEE